MTKLTTELELSPHVIAYLRARGLCVHGEVAMFGKSIFIDHVGHTGPCDCPEYVVAVEMKRRSDKSLRRQAWKLDIYHVADEIWGATIATPREATIKKWDNAYKGGRWTKQGLMSFDGEGFTTHIEAARLDDKYLHRNTKKLLLCEENRDVLAGYPSGGQEYHTHYKLLRAWVEAQLERHEEVTTKELFERVPHYASCYSNPRSAISTVLRDLSASSRARRVKRGTWTSCT